jgi:hypothetical protein
MIYLTASHGPVPDFVVLSGMRHPTELALRQNDTARLAQLGIYPHQPPTDPAPLGTTWTLTGGVYVGTPSGTPAQIAAALAEQTLAAQRTVWAERAAIRRREAAIRTLKSTLVETSPAAVQARLDALNVLIGA